MMRLPLVALRPGVWQRGANLIISCCRIGFNAPISSSSFSSMESRNVLCLLDVDGTVTPPRQKILPEMEEFLFKLKLQATIGLVGGSDVNKITEQLGGSCALQKYDYIFSENGLVTFKNGEVFHVKSIASHLSDETLQEFINFCLQYLSQLSLPFKRGTFIEFRKGLINVSPVGRNCCQAERDAFEAYDREHLVRQKFIDVLKKQFQHLDLVYSIGGQISFDVFPKGWDKTYALGLLENEGFKTIHFFGDKIEPGGNDHEIFIDSRTIGHAVLNPEDTKKQLIGLFGA